MGYIREVRLRPKVESSQMSGFSANTPWQCFSEGGSSKASVISGAGSRPRHNLRYHCHRAGLWWQGRAAGGALLLAEGIGVLEGEESIEGS